MKQTKKMKRLLEHMAQIARMERGKLCRMGSRPHYNHQTWQGGRNVVRYVPAGETDFVREAIAGYQQFIQLAEQYADEVIRQTRRERDTRFAKAAKSKSRAQTTNPSSAENAKNKP
jgi:hypothetical protein